MKAKSKFMAMLLAFTMVFTYMPAIVFAEGQTDHEHQMSEWMVIESPGCTSSGIEERICIDPLCPDVDSSRETRTIPAPGHEWGAWTGTVSATIYTGGINTRICNNCGAHEQASTSRVTPFIAWAYKAGKVPRKSKVTFKVALANGDRVIKWKSSKKKIATVNSAGVVKGKKNGKTKITAYTASGLKISCTVKVVKPSKKKKKASSGGGTVYWTPAGSVYHRSASCPTLSRSRTIYEGTIKESGKGRCCKVCG